MGPEVGDRGEAIAGGGGVGILPIPALRLAAERRSRFPSPHYALKTWHDIVRFIQPPEQHRPLDDGTVRGFLWEACSAGLRAFGRLPGTASGGGRLFGQRRNKKPFVLTRGVETRPCVVILRFLGTFSILGLPQP